MKESSLKENRSMPRAKATPSLTYRDMAKAIEWLTHTFGFREVWRIENHGALLEFEGAEVFVREPRIVGEPGVVREPKAGEVPQPLAAVVEEAAGAACRGSLLWRMEGDPPDLNRFFEEVVRRGAQVLMRPRDEVYGERQFAVQDLDGHHWTFSATIKDIAPQEWGARVAPTTPTPTGR
jgi:uncharacterized glyoxalase superfamily protein PhnB